jgi:microcystin-dependent protein
MGGVSANRLTGLTGGVNGDTLGATGGDETHVLTTAQLAAHGHPYFHTNDGGGAGYTGGLATSTNGTQKVTSAFSGTPSTTDGEQIGGSGSDEAHNNVQPTIIFNTIIKT